MQLFKAIRAAFLVLFFLLGLKVVDLIIAWRMPRQAVAVVDLNQPELTMNTLDVYPYDGAHTQADFIIKKSGGALWAGDHGFFIDFDLDNPPPKQPGEIRVINIGGSGAAGWGAQNNYNMVYHRLEKRFNDALPCGPDVWLRVINLAMGGTHSYQNFIALNRWAHRLQPDLLLSYPGNNDLYVTFSTHTDGYYGFPTLGSLVELSRHTSSPGWVRWIDRIYPGLIRGTKLGLALRSLDFNRIARSAQGKYTARFPGLGPPPRSDAFDETQLTTVLENITRPLVVHAFKSMKRDFDGIPIMIAWQAYMFPVDKERDPSIDVTIPVPLYWKLYEKLRRGVEAELRGYINDGWHFLDTHEYYHRNLAARFPPGDGVHLSDEKANVISEVLSRELFPLLCRDHRNRPRRPPTDGPFLYAGVPAVSFPPRVLAQRAGRPVIQLDGRDLAMTSARAGALEGVIRVPEGTRFSGWAIDEEASLPAREVVILANGRLIGRARPSAPRRDLAKTNERLLSSGWSIVVPANGSLHGRIRLFAVMADGTARELNYLQPYPFATGSGGSTP